MKKENKKLLLGIVVTALFFLFCSMTFKVNHNQADIRTITEEGHKYVVAVITNAGSSNAAGISIIHSEACPCKK